MTSQQSDTPDGSGLAIHTDAPIVRAARNSSGYTRGSYACVLVAIFLMRWAWLDIHFHDASTSLTCEEDECTIIISPPERAKPLTLKIVREQIIDSMALQVHADGEPVLPINTATHHRHFNNRHKHHEGEEEEHESYAVVLSQSGHTGSESDTRRVEESIEESLDGIVSPEKIMMMEKFGSAAMTDPDLMRSFEAQKNRAKMDKEKSNPAKQKSSTSNLPSLDALDHYADKNHMGEYVLIMRRYNIGHTRRRVTTLITRIKQYAKNHRDRIIIREKRNVRWQGILGIVFGMFSLLLALMVGQFSDPQPTFGGPGATQRRRKTKQKTPKSYGGYDNGS